MSVALVELEGWKELQAGLSDFSSTGRWVSGTGTYDSANGRIVGPQNFRRNLPGGSTCVMGLYWSSTVQQRAGGDTIIDFYAGSTRVMRLLRYGDVYPISPILSGTGLLSLTHENGEIVEPVGPAPLTERDTHWIVVAMSTVGAGSKIEVRVNGTVRSAFTQTLTLPARTIDNVRFSNARATVGPLYIRNESVAFGSSDFWPAPNVDYLPGSATGTYPQANWVTPDGSPLQAALGDFHQDADATYALNQTTPTGSIGDRFSMGLSKAPAALDSILGIRFGAACRRSFGTASTHRIVLNQGATDSAGTTVTTGAGYGYLGDRVRELSPFSGGATAWAPAELLTTEVGVEQMTLS